MLDCCWPWPATSLPTTALRSVRSFRVVSKRRSVSRARRVSVWWPRRTLPSSTSVTGMPVVVRSSSAWARVGRFSASRTCRSLNHAVRSRVSLYQSRASRGWFRIAGGTKSDG